MDISITQQPNISTPGSSQSVKRSSPGTSNTPSKPRKIRKLNVNYPRKGIADDDGVEEAYTSHLTDRTKNIVLQLKKVKDPFNQDLQKVMDNVLHHLHQQPEEEVNLVESALLLSTATQVYSSQVTSLHKYILDIASRLTGRENPHKRRGKKKKGEDETHVEGGSPSQIVGENHSGATVEEGYDAKEGLNTTNTLITSTNDRNSQNDADISTENATENDNVEQQANSGQENEAGVGGLADCASQISVAGGQQEGQAASLPNQVENQTDSNKPDEIPTGPICRQSERLKNILEISKETERERDYTLKKRKYNEDVPTLISCHAEWDNIMKVVEQLGDINYDEMLPPTLESRVGRRRIVTSVNNNDGGNGNAITCEPCTQHSSTGSGISEQRPEEIVDAIIENPLPVNMEPQNSNDPKYETLDHLSSDVQEKFHSVIQELHTLPFDGLMKKDMFETYQKKFSEAVSLLASNSVLVKKTEAESAASKTVTASDHSGMTNQTISSIEELLNHVRKQATEEYNKGKQLKSEADVPIGQMIATLRRIICQRYKKWHVRTDGDEEVYKRIRDFENKVKSVLKKEEQQGIFDVRKYEMEIMDVTLKQSQDEDSEELIGCPLSPRSPIHTGIESPNHSASPNSRRVSIAGSAEGFNGWVRLIDIFSNLKKIDNSEICRHFYAVLALLSGKNLSVNYDALFSPSSAKLIKKLSKGQDEQATHNDKYSVGAKIMTSRCPDADKDDVFLTPVFHNEPFNQMLQDQNNLNLPAWYSSQQENATSFLSSQLQYSKSIQDAINEFVEDPDPPELMETDDLFKKK